jgi:hypothetical protein
MASHQMVGIGSALTVTWMKDGHDSVYHSENKFGLLSSRIKIDWWLLYFGYATLIVQLRFINYVEHGHLEEPIGRSVRSAAHERF